MLSVQFCVLGFLRSYLSVEIRRGSAASSLPVAVGERRRVGIPAWVVIASCFWVAILGGFARVKKKKVCIVS